jgi:hypothetical protein
VGALLARKELWQAWMANNPDEVTLLTEAFGNLVRIMSKTGWDEKRALDRLGCETATDDELLQIASERLGLCSDYFAWVDGLLAHVDLQSDMRLAVPGAARVFAAANKDLARARSAMQAGRFSALEYLKLGEIAQSWQCAIRHLDGPRGELARTTYDANPFIDDSAAHLSPQRIRMLASTDTEELLGVHVAVAMRDHIRVCLACREAERALAPGAAEPRVGALA